MQSNFYQTIKVLAGILGAALAYLKPTIPYGLICTLAVLLDCLSAWLLCRRVKNRRYSKKPSVAAYFTSRKMGKTFTTILRIYSLIVLAYLIDTFIFPFVTMYLANIVAGAFCFCQIWSILENESSENDAKWARVLQKIMVDKASRHLDIDMSGLEGKNSQTAARDSSADSECPETKEQPPQ